MGTFTCLCCVALFTGVSLTLDGDSDATEFKIMATKKVRPVVKHRAQPSISGHDLLAQVIRTHVTLCMKLMQVPFAHGCDHDTRYLLFINGNEARTGTFSTGMPCVGSAVET